MPRAIVIPSKSATPQVKGTRAVKSERRVNRRRENDWADSGKVMKDGTPLNSCRGCQRPIRTYLTACSACRAQLAVFWRGLEDELAALRLGVAV